MATAVFGLLNYTLLSSAESTTGWTTFDLLDSDFAKESSNAITGTFRNDLTAGYYDAGGAPITAVGKHLRFWANSSSKPYMEPESGGGVEVLAYDGTTTEYKTMFGSDTYAGGWFNLCIDMTLFTTLTLANVDRWGLRVNYHTAAKNVDNTWIDYVRYLDGYYLTGGTSGDELDLALIALRDIDDGAGTPVLRGYGVIANVDGVFFSTGKLILGNSTTTTYFLMDGEVLSFVDNPVAAGFHEFSVGGTAADVSILDSVIQAAGTTDEPRFTCDLSAASSLTMSGTVLIRAGAITFASGQTATACTFNNCGQIEHAGATLNGSVIKNCECSVASASIYYNVAVDPDGTMDNMSFTKGDIATHAIEFGLTSPLTMTLTGIDFSGYNGSNAQTDSTFLVSRTTGTVTINLSGCSGNMTYKTAGATVVLVIDPVATTITVKDIDTGTEIEDARVILLASDATGGLPFEESVTITSATTTATVAHTGHGLVDGDFALIQGANQNEYNGAYEVTVTGVDAYTYTFVGSATTPATGTIISTGGFFNNLTNASGVVTDTRSLSSDQPVEGRVRKSTSSPLYKSSPISGTVDTVSGLGILVLLIPDE